jgi:hypothetical protein
MSTKRWLLFAFGGPIAAFAAVLGVLHFVPVAQPKPAQLHHVGTSDHEAVDVYHDDSRGMTCYVARAGISCFDDNEMKLRFYCWKADGDHNQCDNRAHDAESPQEAAIAEATFKVDDLHYPRDQNVWVQYLDGSNETIALIEVEALLPTSARATTTLATTRLRWIDDEAAWHKEMSR